MERFATQRISVSWNVQSKLQKKRQANYKKLTACPAHQSSPYLHCNVFVVHGFTCDFLRTRVFLYV